MNTKAFNEQVVMVSKGLLKNEINGIVMIHTEKDGNVVSSYSIDVENGSDVYAIIGVIEAMKRTIMNKFIESTEDDEE